MYPAGAIVPYQLCANMKSTGYSHESRVTDLQSMLVYKNGAANSGWTLPANDTLTIWTALAAVRPTGGTVAQGLDSLKKEIEKAASWYRGPRDHGLCLGDCMGTRGNVNKSVSETPDLSDLSLLVAYFVGQPRPTLPSCVEADMDGSGILDLSDLSILIAYLTIEPRPTLPNC